VTCSGSADSVLWAAIVKILTRMCTSLDGCVTTADARPVQLAFPGWDAGALGFYELQARCDAVLMGRTTFEPALSAPFWPWGDLGVYVLGSHRPEPTPSHVVFDHSPTRLLEQLRGASKGGDVHLVGGPKTIETFRALGALDELRLLFLPMLAGAGRQLTADVNSDTSLTFVDSHRWPAGVMELIYRVSPPSVKAQSQSEP
jgi:dihydrofolate reductase